MSQYAEALAEYKDRSDDQPVQPGQNQPEARPEDVPPKATTTIKEINDNRYYYWQWREGDSIKSKYKGPVDGE